MALIGTINLSIYLTEIVILIVMIGGLSNSIVQFKSIRKDLFYFLYVAVFAFISLGIAMYFSLFENVSKFVGFVGSFFEVLTLIVFLLLLIRLWKKIDLRLSFFIISLFIINMILTIFKTLNKSDFLILVINLITFIALIILYFMVVDFIIRYRREDEK